jgi:hypothetical protein
MPIPRTRTTPLPGIGVQHGLTTQAGQHLSVIAHRDGSRTLNVYRRDDPDACAVSLHFTDEEAAVLADALTPGQRDSGLVCEPSTSAVAAAVRGVEPLVPPTVCSVELITTVQTMISPSLRPVFQAGHQLRYQLAGIRPAQRPSTFPGAANCSRIRAQNAGRSSGQRLEVMFWSVTTSRSTALPPALRMSVLTLG